MSKLNQLSALGKTALEAVVEMFFSVFTRELDRNHVRFELDVANSELIITSLDQTASGATGIYRGTARVPYLKADLSQVCPYPLAVQATYPVTFRELRAQLRSRYDIILEQGEMATKLNGTPLTDEMTISEPLMAEYGQFKLYATQFSGRYRAGTSMTLIFIQPNKRVPLSALLDLENALSMKPLMVR